MSRAVRVPVGPDGRPLGRDVVLAGLLSSYQDAVVRSTHLDPVLTELVRLRCARQHDCRICQTLRLAEAAVMGTDAEMTAKIDYYESSDLDERSKVALCIVDAFIWRPTDLADELVTQARSLFTEAELAELLVDITKWSTQKIHVSLGTDGIDRLEVNDEGVVYFGFGEDGRVAGFSPTPTLP